jgi:hypothetical protein
MQLSGGAGGGPGPPRGNKALDGVLTDVPDIHVRS